MKGHLTFLWLWVLMLSICVVNARQIRISRYTTEVSEAATDGDDARSGNDGDGDDVIEIEAIVREIKLAPYPAAGYRPSKAFFLPNEIADDLRDNESVTEESLGTSTTADGLDVTTTTEGYASETTTAANKDDDNDDGAGKAPYPAAGFRPKIPFILPTANLVKEGEQEEQVTEANETLAVEEATTEESVTSTPLADFTTPSTETEAKTPYPPAGFKPKILFLLPTDYLLQERQQAAPETTDTSLDDPTTPAPVKETKAPYPAAGFRPLKAFLLPTEQLKQAEEDEKSEKEDNSKHPVCGSSTNPLAPKPLDGEKTDPESETIFPSPQTVVVPMRLAAQPLILSRPFSYTTHLQSW